MLFGGGVGDRGVPGACSLEVSLGLLVDRLPFLNGIVQGVLLEEACDERFLDGRQAFPIAKLFAAFLGQIEDRPFDQRPVVLLWRAGDDLIGVQLRGRAVDVFLNSLGDCFPGLLGSFLDHAGHQWCFLGRFSLRRGRATYGGSHHEGSGDESAHGDGLESVLARTDCMRLLHCFHFSLSLNHNLSGGAGVLETLHKEVDAVAARLLGRIHRLIGMAHQFVRRFPSIVK